MVLRCSSVLDVSTFPVFNAMAARRVPFSREKSVLVLICALPRAFRPASAFARAAASRLLAGSEGDRANLPSGSRIARSKKLDRPAGCDGAVLWCGVVESRCVRDRAVTNAGMPQGGGDWWLSRRFPATAQSPLPDNIGDCYWPRLRLISAEVFWASPLASCAMPAASILVEPTARPTVCFTLPMAVLA